MGLKERLEAAGYDTSSLDENTILSKLENAGYDTTPLRSQQPQPVEKAGMKEVLSSAFGKAAQLASPIDNVGMLGMKAADTLQNKVPEQMAEQLAAGDFVVPSAGTYATTALGMTPKQKMKMSPTMAAITATAAGVAPDVLMAGSGIGARKAIEAGAKNAAAEATPEILKKGAKTAGRILDPLIGPGKDVADAQAAKLEAGFIPKAEATTQKLSDRLIKPLKEKINSIRLRGTPKTVTDMSERVSTLKQLKDEIPVTRAKELRDSIDQIRKSKMMMQKIEEDAGIGFKQLGKPEPTDIKYLSKKLEKITKMGADEAVDQYGLPQLQQTRKQVEEMIEKGTTKYGDLDLQQKQQKLVKIIENNLHPDYTKARTMMREGYENMKNVRTKYTQPLAEARAEVNRAQAQLAKLKQSATQADKLELRKAEIELRKLQDALKSKKQKLVQKDVVKLQGIKQKAAEIREAGAKRSELRKKLFWTGAGLAGLGGLKKYVGQ